MSPKTKQKFASSFTHFLQALQMYQAAHKETYEHSVADDSAMGPGFQKIMAGVETLLSGELGGLQGGDLDRTLRTIAQKAGFDPNTLELK